MEILVGYTGFVGSNIYESKKFDYVFNSKNIKDSYGKKPDLLIYAGINAEKYLANENPQADMDKIFQAQDNIKKIHPKKIVLISTIDVFKNPINVYEDTLVDSINLSPYGYNRYKLECWVKDNYKDSIIIRLPALFGKNIKKNFIYDYINRIPNMLNENMFSQLLKKEPTIVNYYDIQENGYYKCKILSNNEKEILKKIFLEIGFSSLNFTDTRNKYQFYPLNRLWNDINIAIKNDIKLLHLATEPINVGELYYHLSKDTYINIIGNPLEYDFKTIYSKLFYGKDGYIMDKNSVKNEIRKFIYGRNVYDK